jgi:hypothetical protein
MPCRDYPFDGPTRAAEDARKKLDIRTAQLCRALTALEEHDMLDCVGITANMRKWWRQHKEADARNDLKERQDASRRAKKSKLKKSGLSKLTPAEKEALKL